MNLDITKISHQISSMWKKKQNALGEEAIEEQKLMKKIMDDKDEQCFVEEKSEKMFEEDEEMGLRRCLDASRVKRGVWRQG